LRSHRQVKAAGGKPFAIKLDRSIELSHGAKYSQADSRQFKDTQPSHRARIFESANQGSLE
jgi:hypothetical protein